MKPRTNPPPAPERSASEVRAKHLAPNIEHIQRESLKHGRRRGAELLNEMLDRRGIPASELAEAMRIPRKELHEMRFQLRAVKVEHIFAMPQREALAYLDSLRSAVLNDNAHR